MLKVSIIVPDNDQVFMPRILDIFLGKKTNNNCTGYSSPALLFAGLEREEPGAIRCLSSKISGSVYQIGKKHQLTNDDIEELICDCITLCLLKIKHGKYVFQGYDPSTFAVEIAKNKARNFRRTAIKHNTLVLDDMSDVPENTDDFTGQAETDHLEKILKKLDENCQNLVRLKYLEEMRDKDVIEQKITQYTTVDALKNNRARCMKKLIEIAKDNGKP